MKKLMTMLAAAATAFGLYAADSGFLAGAGFDTSDTANPTPGAYTWLYDAQTTTGDFVSGWWSSTEGATFTAGESLPSDNDNRPLQFQGAKDHSNDGYIAIQTQGTGLVGQYVNSGDPKAIAADGLYFDGLVQFTAFDEMPTIADDAKIAVFPMLNDPDNESQGANLVIKAFGTETNLWPTTESIDGEWHRVTIKMINNILKNGSKVGFVVFIDGSTTPVCFDSTKVSKEFADADLTAEAAYYNKIGALFGALTGDAYMSEVAFGGKGAIDEIAFTANAPTFAASPKFYTVGFDATVASVDELSTNPQEIIVTGDEDTYNYTAQDGYISSSTSFVGVAGQTYTITAAKLGASVLKWDGEEWVAVPGGQVSTFADALALVTAGDKFKIALAQDEGAITIDKAGCDLTIDLAGNTIASTSEEVAAIDVKAGALTIIDSSEGAGKVQGKEIEAGSYGPALAMPAEGNAATLAITAGTFDGAVSNTTEDNAEVSGTCKFSVEGNMWGETTVLIGAKLPLNTVWDVEGDYLVLKTTIAVTFADGTNSTISPDAGTSNYVAGTKLTITATAAADCRFGEVSAPWEKVSDTVAQIAEYEVTAADTITAPDAVAINYVAQINEGQKYETLGAAIDALEGGETITLLGDYTLTADETKIFTKNATLDLGTKTLTVPDALRTKLASFEVAKGATVTFQNGTIDLGPTSGSYGIAVLGTLNVDCTITRTTTANHSPVFDVYDGTVNFLANADITTDCDIVRAKSLRDDEDELTSVVTTVTVAEGAKLKATGTGKPIFYCYKTCTKLVATLNGGEFTAGEAVFGDDNKDTYVDDKGKTVEKNETWDVTIDAAKAKFANDKIEYGKAVGKIIPNQKPILNQGDNWYYLQDAAIVALTADDTKVTVADVAAGDKFAAGETVTFTVTEIDSTKDVIDAVTVNGDTLTAPYSWEVPATLPGSIAIVVTTKSAVTPIEPVDPEKPIEASAEDINKNIEAYLNVPKGVTDESAYRQLFHAVDNGDGTASIVLTTDAEAAIKDELNTAAVETSILAPDGDGNATLKTKPGLFYGIAAADNLTLGSEQVAKDGWTMATDTELKVKVPKVTGDKAFFKPVCSAVAK